MSGKHQRVGQSQRHRNYLEGQAVTFCFADAWLLLRPQLTTCRSLPQQPLPAHLTTRESLKHASCLLQGPGGPVGPKGEVSGRQRTHWLHQPGPQHESSLPRWPRGSSVGWQLQGLLASDPRGPVCPFSLAAEGSWARKASRVPTAPAAWRACPGPLGPWASRACKACLASPGNPASRYVLSLARVGVTVGVPRGY